MNGFLYVYKKFLSSFVLSFKHFPYFNDIKHSDVINILMFKGEVSFDDDRKEYVR